ncbi:RNA methyltransferase [Paracoccus suum]|uniref:RNA methyltransferase n=3 Tax=Paracoccaceae TaxID=31989 RepID=A0A1W6CZJ5_9RHOB|nr:MULTISPECIES: DNA methyltransferase [Paracoccaceae]ARJ70278.1 RNA methyltransferase [Paracoccus contaminans]AXC50826.1 RNA methyltransferase [Paracoccus suum]RHZ90451.1 RNA methyltransferase [Cereibacter sphaeroides]
MAHGTHEPTPQKTDSWSASLDPETAARSSLSEVDWGFPDRRSHSEIEGVHPYPAKFIAEIPRALINCLPLPPHSGVLDPFCGSGSSLVESQRLGIPAVGVDLNPIACLMSRVKTSACPTDIEQLAARIVASSETASDGEIPEIPNLDHWFQPNVQVEINKIARSIATSPSEARDALKLALSSIIVRVSNQESDTRYAAVQKDIDPSAVPTLFLRAVNRINAALQNRPYPLTSVDVIENDILKVEPSMIGRPIGLVVTSPPYPNAYEYWLYHKYRMWWLGYDPLKVKADEIGARAHFFKKNHHTAEDFARQMRQTLKLLGNVLVKGGFASFVVGRSKIHGKIYDNSEIITDEAAPLGFTPFFVTERELSANRKSFNLSHANIKTETVLVLRKEVE